MGVLVSLLVPRKSRVAAALTMLGVLPLAVPWPRHEVLRGALWAPALAQVRAEAEGDVEAPLVQAGEVVRMGQPLFRMRLQASAPTAQPQSYVQAHASGEFVSASWRDPSQRPVARGTLLGYVLSPSPSMVRVQVPAEVVAALREQAWRWRVMLDERPGVVLAARLVPDSLRPVATPGMRGFTADLVLEERIGRVGGVATVRADLPARAPLMGGWQWLRRRVGG
jgi:pyruvate/2-oxoglutarate dehydrogenase complex dihydrolipoamide acyltransferase (E2) component